MVVDVCRPLGVYIRTDGSVSTTAAVRKLMSAEVLVLPANRICGFRHNVKGATFVSESGL